MTRRSSFGCPTGMAFDYGRREVNMRSVWQSRFIKWNTWQAREDRKQNNLKRQTLTSFSRSLKCHAGSRNFRLVRGSWKNQSKLPKSRNCLVKGLTNTLRSQRSFREQREFRRGKAHSFPSLYHVVQFRSVDSLIGDTIWSWSLADVGTSLELNHLMNGKNKMVKGKWMGYHGEYE